MQLLALYFFLTVLLIAIDTSSSDQRSVEHHKHVSANANNGSFHGTVYSDILGDNYCSGTNTIIVCAIQLRK